MADSVCAVCGNPFSAEVYLIQDKITDEKKQVCHNCTMLNPRCYICGLPVAKADFTPLPDGRALCSRDARNAVIDEQEANRIANETRQELDRLLSRFLIVPETNVVFETVDRPHLQQLFKIAGQDFECPIVYGYIESQTNEQGRLEHSIHLLSGLPTETFRATCAHEFTHAWLNENLTEDRRHLLVRDAVEGFCELVAFLLMDARHEEGQKKLILQNAYTRGQIQLFIEAERRYGFEEVADWMRGGADKRLVADDLERVRKMESGRTHPAPERVTRAALPLQPAPVPDKLVLKGILWSKKPVALINDGSFQAQEQGKVRLGKTNVMLRCLEIRQNSVHIRLLDSGDEQELRLQSSSGR